jgi:hypothetical protein
MPAKSECLSDRGDLPGTGEGHAEDHFVGAGLDVGQSRPDG